MSYKVELYCEYVSETRYINQDIHEFDVAQSAHNEILMAYLVGKLNSEMDTLFNFYNKISEEIDDEITAYWETFDHMYDIIFALMRKN